MDTNLVQDDAKLRARRFLDSCGGSVGKSVERNGDFLTDRWQLFEV